MLYTYGIFVETFLIRNGNNGEICLVPKLQLGNAYPQALLDVSNKITGNKTLTSTHPNGKYNMNNIQRITFDPAQCGGRPCIRGLRIKVQDILDLLAAGASDQEILEDFPYLEAQDITAALEYAARQCDHLVLCAA
jgi:uncharacterized protein (DUF433 family)